MRTQTIVLTGHLTVEALARALATVDARESSVLLVDAAGMTGYDNAARDRFVAWNAEARDRIKAVAIVTDRALWRVVITAMSLASRQRMQAFATRPEAEAWANGLG